MLRRMRQAQNLEKALEVRLEGFMTEYYVTLAGMTITLAPQGLNGFCDSVRLQEYVQIENDTYKVHTFYNYNLAVKKYQDYVTLYGMQDEKG